MRRILVTGRGGQLATGLEASLPAQGFEAVLVGQPDFEFDQPETVQAAFAAVRPDAVVNTAAWTAVDAAEDDEPAAFRANALGPALLGRLCGEAGIPLVQISTDYVYDGLGTAPYVETALPNPSSAYGRTKLAGEWAALAACPQTLVLRTAWVYSPVGRNFVRTMLAVGAQRPELRVVNDQHGNPTSAPDLADAIAGVLARVRETGWQASYRGVFHAAGSGHTHWHEFAEAIFAAAAPFGGPRPVVHPVGSHEYPTKAKRPANSRLDTGKLKATFGVELPAWQDGLAQVVKALHAG
ncbi:dTDP-4-dehydrorhamnose reductase [Falsiroseomonas selenitidurans]|uniref:dTDP-4-dehydrorhamnose reductase n=1 Tax=Falsiroseomonas selenitidurans TaxID=2716335 RepID=A0ABX1E4F6_9PROT|nr:dTDP-4-dehydrorhamnose reductase [Falsiroseomonas selenitidurans]NKC32069.1 dTDP-4-dehydrorhamnose reductase [Falsiroseomonas selenitidurans]